MTAIAATDVAAQARSKYRWVVLSVIVVVYMLAAADRANIGIALPYIQKEFGATNAQVGLLVSAFFLFYSLGQIPAGFLLSKVGVRVVAPVSIGLTSIVTLLIGTAHNFGLLKIYRSALGIAEAALPLSMLSTINRWFPAREKGLATGAFLSAAKMGAVIAPPIGAALIMLDGWRTMFFAFAIPGVVLALIWWWLVPNDPRAGRRVNDAEATYIEDQQNRQCAHSQKLRCAGHPAALQTNTATGQLTLCVCVLEHMGVRPGLFVDDRRGQRTARLAAQVPG